MASHWGSQALPGERSVANHDEDSLTLAVAASLGALPPPLGRELDGVFFASTTSPYREKLAAATVAAVLDAPPTVRTLDFGDSLRAAAGAVFTAFDLVAAGANERILVAAGDVRRAMPDTMEEQGAGDAGAAVVVTGEAGGLELVARGSVSEEFHGSWRTDAAPYTQNFPGGLDAKLGYGRVVPQVIKAVLADAGVAAPDVACAVLSGSNPRAIMTAAAHAGFDPRWQLQDPLWMGIGDTGAAQPLLLLAAALESAGPGDLLLWVAYGDGADAALFRVGERIPELRPVIGVGQQIERKRNLNAYGRYARFRDLVKRDYVEFESSSAAILYRDRKQMLPLYGGRCPKCGTLQFPLDRVCVACRSDGGLEETQLPRNGTVFTHYENHVLPHPDPPLIEAVVELPEGARFFCHVTDAAPGEICVGTPVELVFRRHHGAGGLHNYFWKARPS